MDAWESLIPGLPDDIAALVLARVSPACHGRMRAVSRAWGALVASAEFRAQRARLGLVRDWLVVLAPGRFAKGEGRLRRHYCLLQLHVFDCREREWLRGLAPVPEEICMAWDYSAHVAGGRLFVLGGQTMGRGEQSCLDTVWSWDFAANRWARHAPMLTSRACMASAAAGGHIYVAGGYTNDSSVQYAPSVQLRSCEVYSIADDRWEAAGALARPRAYNLLSMLEIGGRLYAKEMMGPTACVELDLGEGGVEQVEPASPESYAWWLALSSFYGPKALAAGRHLFGVDKRAGGANMLKRFSPAEREWRDVADLAPLRADAGLLRVPLLLGGRLAVVAEEDFAVVAFDFDEASGAIDAASKQVLSKGDFAGCTESSSNWRCLALTA